jgi:hypothetical protein
LLLGRFWFFQAHRFVWKLDAASRVGRLPVFAGLLFFLPCLYIRIDHVVTGYIRDKISYLGKKRHSFFYEGEYW